MTAQTPAANTLPYPVSCVGCGRPKSRRRTLPQPDLPWHFAITNLAHADGWSATRPLVTVEYTNDVVHEEFCTGLPGLYSARGTPQTPPTVCRTPAGPRIQRQTLREGPARKFLRTRTAHKNTNPETGQNPTRPVKNEREPPETTQIKEVLPQRTYRDRPPACSTQWVHTPPCAFLRPREALFPMRERLSMRRGRDYSDDPVPPSLACENMKRADTW